MLKDEIKKVKLKKVLNKKSSNINVNDILCNSSEDYYKLLSETYIEKYFNTIKPYSFETLFQTLTRDQANLITILFNKYMDDKNIDIKILIERNEKYKSLLKLSKIIDEIKNNKNWSYIFIRLSSRSPKDVAITLDNFQHELEEQQNFLENNLNYKNNNKINTRIHALYRASTYVLACKTGIDAVLLLCKSKRIQDDLIKYINDSNEEKYNIVIRHFHKITVEFEFRAFVYNRKLTGITQYNEFCFFPILKTEIKEKEDILLINIIIEEFKIIFNKLIETIPLKHFIIDFIFAPKDFNYNNFSNKINVDDYKIYIIELNPFAEFAGSGLFSWDNFEDNQILTGKKINNNLDIRINNECPPIHKLMGNISNDWKPYIN